MPILGKSKESQYQYSCSISQYDMAMIKQALALLESTGSQVYSKKSIDNCIAVLESAELE